MESFDQLQSAYQLSVEQVAQFERYLGLLSSWNNVINLTAITQPVGIMQDHFADSLQLSCVLDMHTIKSLVDVGSGGGFPGIPLKIKYPHLRVILIEVVQKKVTFLKTVIKELGLTNIEVIDSDWRTFLRHTQYPMQVVVARASLQVAELLRMFQPSSAYQYAQLVYWASAHWQPALKEEAFVVMQKEYKIADKKRRLVVFQNPRVHKIQGVEL